MRKIALALVLAVSLCATAAQSIITERITLSASADSLKLSVLIIKPSAKPRAIVQLVHGMCEYKERYIPFMRFLANQGYVCVMHDHRGHGHSVKTFDDLGYFYDGGYTATIDDVLEVTKMIKSAYPDLPLFLFGHSMGSMVVRSYAKRYDSELSGLIVCGSPSYDPQCVLGIPLTNLLVKQKGGHYRSQKINDMAFRYHNKKFVEDATGPVSPHAWICSNPKVVARYDADPMCNFIFTVNGFNNLFDLMRDAYDRHDWKMDNPDMPIWFIAGADDPCIISERKFEVAAGNMNNVGYTNVTSKLYPNMRHEILNETKRQTVWNDILAQLNAWTKAAKNKKTAAK